MKITNFMIVHLVISTHSIIKFPGINNLNFRTYSILIDFKEALSTLSNFYRPYHNFIEFEKNSLEKQKNNFSSR